MMCLSVVQMSPEDMAARMRRDAQLITAATFTEGGELDGPGEMAYGKKGEALRRQEIEEAHRAAEAAKKDVEKVLLVAEK